MTVMAPHVPDSVCGIEKVSVDLLFSAQSRVAHVSHSVSFIIV